MGRLPRVYIKGAVYYVTCRGAYNEKLFREKKDYQMYLALLEKYRKEYRFKLFAYVLLPEHLHLLIEPDKGTGISGIMRSLNTAYSKYFNSCHKRKGHLFRERFRASLVEKELYLIRLVAYIHLNPVRAGIAGSPEAYHYSSDCLYRNKTSTREEVKEALEYLGASDYEDCFEQVKKDREPDLHKRLQRGGILGSKEFVNRVREEIVSSREDPPDQRSNNKKYVIISVGVILVLIGSVAILNFSKQGGEEFTSTAGEGNREAVLAVKEIKNLDATEWEMKFSPVKGGDGFSDTISFTKRKFVSAKFSLEGFKPTNYSVAQEREKIIWETIQTKGNDSLFWRGEIERDRMQGILSLRQKGKEPQDFSFMSIRFRRK